MNINQHLIYIEKIEIFPNTISFDIYKGDLIGIIGPNKSGKTTLAKIISRQIYNYNGKVNRIKEDCTISFSDYSADTVQFHYEDFYYQQRYNTSDEADTITVEAYLKLNKTDEYQQTLLNTILPKESLQKKIIELSSGETRKVVLLSNLLKENDIHILDNPFSGLDTTSVQQLISLFKIIHLKFKKTIVLLLNDNKQNIPFSKEIHLKNLNKTTEKAVDFSDKIATYNSVKQYQTIFNIEDATILAGQKLLLQDVNWTINAGEKWQLKGLNGSGKSTLMSILYGDNPIAYRLKLTLFDKPRGSGESIWDIKSRIGFISPEIQSYINFSTTVKSIIQSGYTDTIHLNRKLTQQEEENYQNNIQQFQLEEIENISFGSLSSGEKKIVMMTRALIKNPSVLILDEPFQGIDELNFNRLYKILTYFTDENRTIIQIAHAEHELLSCIQQVATIENNKLTILK